MIKLFRDILNWKSLLTLSAVLLVALFCLWVYNRPHPATIAASEISSVVSDIHQLYASRPDYWKLSALDLKSNDILTKYRYKENQLQNRLGKPMLIGKGANGEMIMPGERSFDVVFTDLSASECVYAVSYQFEHPEQSGLLQVAIVSGDEARVFAWGTNENKLPITRSEAKRFCRSPSSLVWTFE